MEYKIIKNEEHNGLEIYFGEKPSEGIRSALKEIKFRWHGVKKCWYGRAEKTGKIRAPMYPRKGRVTVSR